LANRHHRSNHGAWRCQDILKNGGASIPSAGHDAIVTTADFPPTDRSIGRLIGFRRQFLKLADKASTTKERGEFLRLAFMATLKGEGTGASDEARYRDYLVEQELEARLAESAKRGRQALQPPPPIESPPDTDGRLQRAFERSRRS
jgi:hypothetical protein